LFEQEKLDSLEQEKTNNRVRKNSIARFLNKKNIFFLFEKHSWLVADNPVTLLL
jgi:hypothetical protein